MDWKNKCAQCWGKVRIFWAAFLRACGAAWNWTKVFAGKTRVWLRKVWNKTNIWLTKGWRIIKIVVDKLNLWLGAVCEFVIVNSKRLVGKVAVLALKVRKWTLRKTARLRSWWAQTKARAWIADKAEKIREKLPQPVEEPELDEESLIIADVWDDEPTVRIPVQQEPPRRQPAPRKHGKVVTVLLKIWKIFSGICVWIYRLRKYIMAAPVAYYALKLAFANGRRLPDLVGIDIQASGEFGRMVSRQAAVFGPLGVTAFCLVLVLCSRKPLLPWLISVFTLILPLLIWMTNYYA